MTERELETVIDVAERTAETIEYHDVASPGRRWTVGEAQVLGQAFGDGLLLVATFSPAYTDDVMFGVGAAAIAEATRGDVSEVMLVDAHNCNDGIEGVADLGHVTSGSRRAYELVKAAREAGETLEADARAPMHLGTAWDPTAWTPEEGIGELGVRVAVVEVADTTTGYVLIDGNNMDPGLREAIVDRVATVDELEVMTTDNHAVTRVNPENQVGSSIDTDVLLELIDGLVEEAIADLEPVEAGMASADATVTVFGNDRTETLASHANAVISMGAPLTAAVVALVTGISVLVFFFA